jgi:hypothetical protein
MVVLSNRWLHSNWCMLNNIKKMSEQKVPYEELNQITKEVLKILSDSGLKLTWAKCIFNRYIFGSWGHLSRNKDGWIQIKGSGGAQDTRIKNFSSIIGPLRVLTTKNEPWVWTVHQVMAFGLQFWNITMWMQMYYWVSMQVPNHLMLCYYRVDNHLPMHLKQWLWHNNGIHSFGCKKIEKGW